MPSLSNLLSPMTRSAGALLVALVIATACMPTGQGGSGGNPSSTPLDLGQSGECPLPSAVPGNGSLPPTIAPSPSAEAVDGGDVSCVDGSEDDAVTGSEHSGTDGRNNIIRAINRNDGRLLVRGSVQLNQITGDTVRPSNQAWAVGYQCTDCHTFAVALQVNLIGDHANTVSPENVAVALNYGCTGCVTVARALQYTFTVDDPTNVPNEVRQLIQAMEHELRKIDNEHGVTIQEAEERVNAVIAQFRELAESLDDERDEATETDSPTPSAGPSDAGESPQATPLPSGTPVDVTAAPTSTPSPEAASASPSASPSP